MPRKQWFLLAVALVLAAIYVCWFTGWFKHKDIRIFFTNRPAFSRFRVAGTSATVAFGLDQEYRLTEVEVVPLAAWQTNPDVVPLWHLLGHRESRPTRIFLYGQNIPGMQSVVPGAKLGPLEDRVTYRLFVSAGSVKGQHDFWIGGKPPEETNSTSH